LDFIAKTYPSAICYGIGSNFPACSMDQAAAILAYVRPLIDDPHPHVQEAAQWAVESLEE